MSDDRDWDAELEAAAAVRRRYRDATASESPPAALDDAILAASRRAVSAGPVALGRSPWRRWRAPVAAAAVIVLSTSVGLLIWEEKQHEQWPSAERGPAPSAILPEAENTARMAQPSAPAEVSSEQQASSAPSATPVEAAKRAVPKPADHAPSDVVPTAPPSSREYMLSRREDRPTRDRETRAAEAQPPERSGSDAFAVAPLPASPAPAPVAPPTPVAAEEAVARTAPPELRELPARQQADTQARRSADRAVAAPAAEPSVPSVSGKDTRERSLLSGAERAGRLRGSGPSATAAPRVGRNDEGVEELRAIVVLWEAGRKVEAVEALRQLQCSKPYVPIPPDYPVPRPAPAECPKAAKEPPAPDR